MSVEVKEQQKVPRFIAERACLVAKSCGDMSSLYNSLGSYTFAPTIPSLAFILSHRAHNWTLHHHSAPTHISPPVGNRLVKQPRDIHSQCSSLVPSSSVFHVPLGFSPALVDKHGKRKSGHYRFWELVRGLILKAASDLGAGLTLRGSAIARLAGLNVVKHSDVFEQRVPAWVFEEEVSLSVYMKEPF
jgi:hypothetical protein